MINSIQNILLQFNKVDLYVMIFSVITIAFTALFLEKTKYIRISKKLLTLYGVPFALGIYDASINGFSWHLSGLYICSVLGIICILINKKETRIVLAGIGMVGIIVSLILCLKLPGYNSRNYIGEFYDVIKSMDEHYVLKQYKNIDFDVLKSKYEKKFYETGEENDEDVWFNIWMEYCNEFHDAHVSVSLLYDSNNIQKKYLKQKLGYDYGFTGVNLSDGRVVAASIDNTSDAYAKGLRDGMEITSFDGKSVSQLEKETGHFIQNDSSLENEAFYSALYITSSAGNEADIEFIDESGNSVSTHLVGKEDGYKRIFITYDALNHYCRNDGIRKDEKENPNNLSYEMLTNDTACLYINDMLVPAAGIEYLAENGEDKESLIHQMEENKYSVMKLLIKNEISEIKSKGASNLIIDLRNNAGGYPEVALAIAELFYDGKNYAYSEGRYNEKTGLYESVEDIYLEGENEWGDGKVIVLVNDSTVSAGEHLEYLLGKLPFVTVMGYTASKGAGQAISDIYMERIMISFPLLLAIDENGEVIIDNDSDRKSILVPDIIVPFDEEAFNKTFILGEDYLMNYALSEIER